MKTGRLLLALLTLVICTAAHAQAPVKPAGELLVGVKVAPPFVMRDGDHYTGLAVDVWKKAAAAHGWHYRFKEFDLRGLLDAVAKHQVDAGLGAITATAEREQIMDFGGLAVRGPRPSVTDVSRCCRDPDGFAAGGRADHLAGGAAAQSGPFWRDGG